MTEHERFINEYCRNVGNIKIKCDDCKFVEDCVDYGWDGCRKFTPKPSEPMTNDEWRRTCSTEEFAEFLADICDSDEYGFKYDVNDNKSNWVEWLKRPHKEKS